MNVKLTVREKSIFSTSFARALFSQLVLQPWPLFSFEKHKWFKKILFDVIYLQICHNGATFFLTAVDEN